MYFILQLLLLMLHTLKRPHFICNKLNFSHFHPSASWSSYLQYQAGTSCLRVEPASVASPWIRPTTQTCICHCQTSTTASPSTTTWPGARSTTRTSTWMSSGRSQGLSEWNIRTTATRECVTKIKSS